MRYTSSRRPPFDPDCEFVWLKATKVNGRPVTVGDPVDKAAFTPRRLRQLYGADNQGRPEGAGMIAYAPGQSPRQPRRGPNRAAVGPTDLKHPGLDGQPKPKRRGIPRRRRAA